MKENRFYLKVKIVFTVSHFGLNWNAERWCLRWPCKVHWSGRAFHVCRLQGLASLWFLGLWEGQSSQAATVGSSALWSMAFQFGVIIPGQTGRLVTLWTARSTQRCMDLKIVITCCIHSQGFKLTFHCPSWNAKWMPLSVTVSYGKESGHSTCLSKFKLLTLFTFYDCIVFQYS